MNVTIKLKKSGAFAGATAPVGIEAWGSGDWGPYSSQLVSDAIAAGVPEAGIVYIGAGIASSIMNQGLPPEMVVWSPGDPPVGRQLCSYGGISAVPAATFYEPSLGDFDIVVG